VALFAFLVGIHMRLLEAITGVIDRILPLALVLASFVFSAGVWYARLELAEVRADVRLVQAELRHVADTLRRLEGGRPAQAARYVAE
jgi:hypothetical protein